MEITLECKQRPEGANPRALRRDGFIPANLYGYSGSQSMSLVLSTKEALNLLKKAAVNNTLVDLKVADTDWNGKVLIREVQTHPWKRSIHHISFFYPSGKNTVEVVVPLKIVGHSIGLSEGGILEQMVTEVKVRCFPRDIPSVLEVDITNVKIGGSFHVGDLTLPPGAKVQDDPHKTIISIAAPKKKG